MASAIQLAWPGPDNPTYTTAQNFDFSLDAVSFVVQTDGSGNGHRALLSIVDASQLVPFYLEDANQGQDNSFLTYTFMRGATMTHCTLDTVDFVESPLPVTTFAPQTQFFLSMLDNGGSTVSGDTIGAIVFYGDQLPVSTGIPPQPELLPITLLPGVAA